VRFSRMGENGFEDRPGGQCRGDVEEVDHNDKCN
jgi:hypothetical protein